MVSLSASEILPPIPSGSLTWVLSEKQKSARGQPEPQVDALDDPLWSALTASIRFLIAASSSANSSASWTILSMSSGLSRRSSFVMVIDLDFPVPLSRAETLRIPLATLALAEPPRTGML